MNQKGSNTVRARAEKRAAERLEELHDRSIFRESHEGYTRRPEQNLIPSVEERDFWSDLGAGAGNELVDGTRDPANLCALNRSFWSPCGRRRQNSQIAMKAQSNRWRNPCGQPFIKS